MGEDFRTIASMAASRNRLNENLIMRCPETLKTG